MRNSFKGILILFILIACDSNRVYEDYKTLDSSGWHQDSTIHFHAEISDTVRGHNLFLNIRNKGNYPNSNIWLFLEVQSPAGKFFTDTVEYVLAEKSGKWKGSGIGDLFDNQFLYCRNVVFDTPGEYQFMIRQGMRGKVLKGIHDIGLRIETQKQN